MITKLILILLSGIFISCATSPVSYNDQGQMQVDTNPTAQSPEMIQSGIRTFETYKRSKPHTSNSQVARVGNRIKNVVPLQGAQWEFVTFQNSTPNAFALPGGKVGVHTGILPIAKNDAGLATILAHEIAHVSLNHHGKKQSRQAIVGLGGALVNAALGGGYSNQISSLGQLGVNLPNSRGAEIEADQVGLMYMAKAGYDPREAINFWSRFAQYKNSKGQSSSPLFSTHPLSSTRIEKLKKVLPVALAEYNRR